MEMALSGRGADITRACRYVRLADKECREYPKSGNGDCDKENPGNDFMPWPHDRTPLFNQYRLLSHFATNRYEQVHIAAQKRCFTAACHPRQGPMRVMPILTPN